MLAQADEFGLYAVGAQKLGGNAGVFGAHPVGGGEHRQRAQGDVGQIADGRGDDIQRAGAHTLLRLLMVFEHEKILVRPAKAA